MLVLAPCIGIAAPGRAQMMEKIAFDRQRGLFGIGMCMRAQLASIAHARIFHPVQTHGLALEEAQPAVIRRDDDVLDPVDADFAREGGAVIRGADRADARIRHGIGARVDGIVPSIAPIGGEDIDSPAACSTA